ncbi:hybrid sensor histidine kinase/response regulator [Anaerobacillus alkaliphilus]|uniref:histidine kinase n=1 Tax=Anaerobacillus alkaliphilus TaxID=1548597 RepID=A0A4Q0VP26_9BACI|nr:response regulator [Anaerobacillus alkaliphilus]RXI98192.1 hybrid sensor histidine kinase/response regulator [Anaerobacillus alkaliphilus]
MDQDNLKAKVLLVDDRPENLLALEAVLADGEYELVFAHSGEEALKHILKEEFAVILLDVQMPGLNGFETAKLIKGRKVSAHIPIIFITALSKANEHIKEGYLTGAVDYIFKPFNRTILKSKVDVFVHIFLKQKQIEFQRNKLAEKQMELKYQYNNLEKLIQEKTNELVIANHELKTSQERFQKIFQFSPNLKAICTLENGRFLTVNKSWIEVTGYSVEEINDNGLQFIFSENDVPLNIQVDLHNRKVRFITKEQEVRIGLLSTEKIMINDEECILSVITDITERTKLEKEISRLDSLNLVGEMAAGIAHEIRNPMTTVIGFLQIAKNDLDAPLSEQYINLMLSELKRANGIITEFLTLAKDKTSNKKVENLNNIIQLLYPLLQAEAIMNSKSVHLELGDIPTVNVDEKEMRQMILNIGLNGLEAMSNGGNVTIRTFLDEKGSVVLQIKDEGRGMPKEVLDKIGTPFFTTKENGTGLGMAICYSIAARHDAQISVETSEAGTSFYICFAAERAKIKQLNN